MSEAVLCPEGDLLQDELRSLRAPSADQPAVELLPEAGLRAEGGVLREEELRSVRPEGPAVPPAFAPLLRVELQRPLQREHPNGDAGEGRAANHHVHASQAGPDECRQVTAGRAPKSSNLNPPGKARRVFRWGAAKRVCQPTTLVSRAANESRSAARSPGRWSPN